MMGFSPVEVDRMSIWQLMATADAYAEAHDPAAEQTLSDDDKDWLFAEITKH